MQALHARPSHLKSRWRKWLCWGSILGLLLISVPALAQRPKSPMPTAKKETEVAQGAKRDASPRSEQEEKTKPQAVDLQTDDGVLIAATYFPPIRPGKDVPAVILLHGFGGTTGEKQSVFWPTGGKRDLAFALQERGYAVLTFDFRGHGHSTERMAVRAGEQKAGSGKLDFGELRTSAHFQMLLQDIESAKRFLLQRNNAGELNVAKLAVVGSEMGASLGVLWSYRDWQYPAQAGFSGKQGQDVLALVLISPQYNFKGISINKELTFLQQRIPMQFVVGRKDQKAFNDAEKMFQAARRAMPNETATTLTDLNTKVQAGKLINPDLELDVDKEIASFLDSALKKRAAKWEARELSEGENSK